MPITPRDLADSMMSALGFADVKTVSERSAEEICCGDPTNLDGGAHPWSEVGEDDRGTHYRCHVCGATDTD